MAIEKKALARSITMFQGCKFLLIFSVRVTTSGTVTASVGGDFIQFSIIHSHSPSAIWFSKRPNRIIKSSHGFLNDSHLLKCLNGLSNFLFPPGIRYCFTVATMAGTGSTTGSHFGNPRKMVIDQIANPACKVPKQK